MAQQPESAEAIMAKYAVEFPNGIEGATEAEIVSAYRTFEAQPTHGAWEKQIFLKLDEAAGAAIKNLPIHNAERKQLLHFLNVMRLPLRYYKMILPTVVIPDDADTRAKLNRMVQACREVPHKKH